MSSNSSSCPRDPTEVLGLIVEGLTHREIADRLSITFGTARAHVAAVIHRLDVGNPDASCGRGQEARAPSPLKVSGKVARTMRPQPPVVPH